MKKQENKAFWTEISESVINDFVAPLLARERRRATKLIVIAYVGGAFWGLFLGWLLWEAK